MHCRTSTLALAPAVGLAALLAAALAVATAAGAQVRIGVGAPITGGSAAFGAQIKKGIEQAVEDINAAGGILGQKIVLYVGDDRADPKEGVSVANKFAADGVKFVIGHFNSGVTIPASEVYQENGMLVITPAATNPRVTDRNGCGTCSAFAAATTSRAASPAPSSRRVQGQARRHRPRQDHLRPGTCRGDPQGDECQAASRRSCSKASTRTTRISPPSSPSSRRPIPTSSIGAACTTPPG